VKEELPARHGRSEVLIPPEDINSGFTSQIFKQGTEKIYNILSFCVYLRVFIHRDAWV
jgi:hypothetical protein